MLNLQKKIKLKIKKLVWRENLGKIAECVGGDKLHGHNYIPIYESYFQGIRTKKLNILEIGIGGYEDPYSGGESLLMWSEYFKNSSIIGADLFKKKLNLSTNIKTVELDQSDLKQIEDLGKKHGMFDIIIDDGSHISSHIINTFEILWKYLNNKGIYVIEDTQTSYWSKFGGYDEPNSKRATSYFQNLTDGLNYIEFLDKDYQPSEIQKYLDYIHFYHNIIFIGKSLKDKKSLFVENGILTL
jgi:hypothetical protein